MGPSALPLRVSSSSSCTPWWAKKKPTWCSSASSRLTATARKPAPCSRASSTGPRPRLRARYYKTQPRVGAGRTAAVLCLLPCLLVCFLGHYYCVPFLSSIFRIFFLLFISFSLLNFSIRALFFSPLSPCWSPLSELACTCTAHVLTCAHGTSTSTLLAGGHCGRESDGGTGNRQRDPSDRNEPPLRDHRRSAPQRAPVSKSILFLSYCISILSKQDKTDTRKSFLKKNAVENISEWLLYVSFFRSVNDPIPQIIPQI